MRVRFIHVCCSKTTKTVFPRRYPSHPLLREGEAAAGANALMRRLFLWNATVSRPGIHTRAARIIRVDKSENGPTQRTKVSNLNFYTHINPYCRLTDENK